MKDREDDIKWVKNPGVKKDYIYMIITIIIISVLGFGIGMIFSRNPSSSALVAFIIAFIYFIIWIIISRRNVAQQVGFSPSGVHFRHLGEDKYIHWRKIKSISYEDDLIGRIPNMNLKSGEQLSLGSIDNKIIKKMQKQLDSQIIIEKQKSD